MFKRLLAIFVLLTVNITGITSCAPGGVCTIWVEPPTYCTKITGIDVIPTHKETGTAIFTKDTVSYDQLAIVLEVSETQRSCYKPKPSVFGTSAYACSKIDNILVEDSLRSITITSNADFDDAHKAGTALNDLFEYPQLFYLNGIPLNEAYSFTLNKAPQANYVHEFTVKLTLASGTVIENKTLPLTIMTKP